MVSKSQTIIDQMFSPQAIAVVGANNDKTSVGYAMFKNLLDNKDDRRVYPINIKTKVVQGRKAYPSVSAVPKQVDLAIIATPAKTVPSILKECGENGVKGVIIVASGIREGGKEGKKIYRELEKVKKKYDMRILGPNCLGFIRPSLNLNASFAPRMPMSGNIAFISQSGALCSSVLDWSIKRNVGFSSFVSVGSLLDIGFHDLIDYFGNDPKTESILIYMESLADPRRFMSAARAFAKNKPIVILKAGKSPEGREATKSHTGTLAGNDAVFDAAFERAGVIRVGTIEELYYCAQTLSMQGKPKGNRLAIVTNAGGPGVITTDALVERGGELAKLSPKTMQQLNDFLPPIWSQSNPVDLLGDAKPNQYKKAIQLCLQDPNTDAVLAILAPQAVTQPTHTAKALVSLNGRDGKMLLASWMGGNRIEKGIQALEKGEIPTFRIPEDAIRCFTTLNKELSSLQETPKSPPEEFTPNKEATQKIIDQALQEKRYTLSESESKKILSHYKIPVVKSYLAQSRSKAASLASKIGFPVVMKVSSPDIIHKTDVGGVETDVSSPSEAKKAFKKIMESAKKNKPDAEIKGVTVEKMIEKKYELLIGSKKDPLFGPVIVFGMGGVAVEVFQDTNIALPPLNMTLAQRLIEKTKIYKLLKGYRGMEGVDLDSIKFLLCKFAYLIMDFPEIREMDINPFTVDAEGGTVLDVEILLDKQIKKEKGKPYSHLVISPYPKKYTKTVKIKSGKKVLLRPIKPEDEPLEAELFETFSDETKRFRFFHTIDNITHEFLIRYTQIDYDREIAIIAEVKEKRQKKMAGVVRLIEDPHTGAAEFAIVVGDPWQGKGLGDIMTNYILDIAKDRGVKKVYAVFLKDNRLMKKMLMERGFKIDWREKNYYAELELRNYQQKEEFNQD